MSVAHEMDPVPSLKGHGGLQTTQNKLCAHSADIFSPILDEGVLKKGRYVVIRPNNVNDDGPYEFKIHPHGLQYLQLSATRMHLQLKVVKANGENLPADAIVAVIPGIAATFFNNISIECDGKPVPELTNSHAGYKAYLETIFSFGWDARQCSGRAAGFIGDKATLFDNYDVTNAAYHNDGFEMRKDLCSLSKVMEFYSPIHNDFFQTDKLMPPGFTWLLRFGRASDAFCLVAPTAAPVYKIKVVDMMLHVRYIELTDDLVHKHLKLFDSHNARTHITKTQIRTRTFSTGIYSASWPNMLNGVPPKSIVIGLLQATAFNGVQNKHPFNFKTYDVSKVSLKLSGEEVPTGGYVQNFADGIFIKSYQQFLDNIGINTDDRGCLISPDYFRGGCTFYAFDFSPDMCNGFHFHKVNEGINFDLDITFKNVTPEILTVLMLATYDSIVEFDKYKQILVDVNAG